MVKFSSNLVQFKSYISSSCLFIEGNMSTSYTSEMLLFSAERLNYVNAFLRFPSRQVSQTFISGNLSDHKKCRNIIVNIIYFIRVNIFNSFICKINYPIKWKFILVCIMMTRKSCVSKPFHNYLSRFCPASVVRLSSL
jgi:hypothetical protein